MAEALDAFRRILNTLSTVFIFNQGPTEFTRRFKIVEHRLINLAQIAPGIFVPIEAVQKQHVGQQAEHSLFRTFPDFLDVVTFCLFQLGEPRF